MNSRRTIFLGSRSARQRAHALLDAAPEGYTMRLAPATRSDEQNKIMWARIRDLREQIPEMRAFSPDQVKLRFLEALGCEMTFLPKLEDAGLFPVGMKSSTLTVEQFSALLELMDAYAARQDVTWSNPDAQG